MGMITHVFCNLYEFLDFSAVFLCIIEENDYLCSINLRVIHNKDYSVVNIKESQNYFLIVAVLFWYIISFNEYAYLLKVVMNNIKIGKGVFETPLELEHASVTAGFPSPADDYRHETLDFNRDYIRHPEASFYGDVTGDSMRDAGIFDGDRVIIDKAVEPHDGSIVVAFWNGEFTMKFLDLKHKKDGYIELKPANPDYPVFKISAEDQFEVWGVVIHLIRTFEKV